MIPNGLLPAITEILLQDEGLSHVPYLDTQGNWTIGIGHLIGKELKDLHLPEETIRSLFLNDASRHWSEAIDIFGDEFLLAQTKARQAAILSLVFTLGARKLRGFNETVPAIKAGQWDRAADLLLMTKWARDVDPKRRAGEGRDDRIAFMLRTGEFHADYQIDSLS